MERRGVRTGGIHVLRLCLLLTIFLRLIWGYSGGADIEGSFTLRRTQDAECLSLDGPGTAGISRFPPAETTSERSCVRSMDSSCVRETSIETERSIDTVIDSEERRDGCFDTSALFPLDSGWLGSIFCCSTVRGPVPLALGMANRSGEHQSSTCSLIMSVCWKLNVLYPR